jgi:hypothetical protein
MSKLTKIQQGWLKHVKTCAESKLSLSAYERKHGLPLNSLSRWRSRFRQRGLLNQVTEATQLQESARFKRVFVQQDRLHDTPAFRVACGPSIRMEFEYWPGKEIVSEILSLLVDP